MAAKNNVGVFWSNFDPPTLAHQAIIYKMLELFSNSFIVVKNNATKYYLASLEHRLAMLREILPMETKNYTLLVQDTHNRNDYFDIHKMITENLYVVVGMDALHVWLQQHQADELIKYDGVYVAPRNTNLLVSINQLTRVNILPIDTEYQNISSTAVRATLASKLTAHQSIALNNKVLQYIRNNKLYEIQC